jgi:hypothetical protein
MLTQFAAVSIEVMVVRLASQCLTTMPIPPSRSTRLGSGSFFDDHCTLGSPPIAFEHALLEVAKNSFPPRGCGSSMISLSTEVVVVVLLLMRAHGCLLPHPLKYLPLLLLPLHILLQLASRQSYVVGIGLSLYLPYFLVDGYLLRSKGIMNRWGRGVVEWMEGKDVVGCGGYVGFVERN